KSVAKNSKAGGVLNLSTREAAAFKNVPDGAAPMQEQLRKMLLARYQAYEASGLAGIASYDRGGGRTGDSAADLRKASEATKGLQRNLPVFQQVPADYPKPTAPEREEQLFGRKPVIQN